MAYLEEAVPYVAAFVTMVAGVFGFFWARTGKRNPVGGIGWTALALVVAAGLVAIGGTYLKSRSEERAKIAAAAAGAEAARLEEELRQSVFRQAFVVTTLVGGIPLRQMVGHGGLYFQGSSLIDAPVEPEGFVGPFPALGRTGWGAMRLNLDAGIYHTYRVSPAPGGAVRLTPLEPGRASHLVAPAPGLDEFRRIGPASIIPRDGEWSSAEDVGGYNFGFIVDAQFRRLISILAQERTYGYLAFTLPDASAAEMDRVIQGYRAMRPNLVFDASRPGDVTPVRTAKGGIVSTPCRSFIRIPVEIAHLSTRGQTLYFVLRASSQGLRVPEICENAE